MSVHVSLFLLMVGLFLSLARLRRLCWFDLQPSSSKGGAKRTTLHRLRHRPAPQTIAPPVVAPPLPRRVEGQRMSRPWREGKSRRGAPKRIDTAGFACPNPQCAYFGNTDAHIHALLGDGKHGQTGPIQTFRCQACRTTFTRQAQHGFVSSENPLPADLHRALCGFPKGWMLQLLSASQGYRHVTITTWLSRAGEHAELLHKHSFRNLHLPHLQVDEIRTRLRRSTQVLWLWLAIDPCTKLLPVLQLGPRTQNAAHTVIHSVQQILAPGCIPLFTRDGLHVYFYALTAHFGDWFVGRRRDRNVRQWRVAAGLIYGQVKKSYRRRKLVRVTHIMRLGTENALTVALQGLGFSGRLNTAFIERVNLTIRHGVAALARRTWATSQQASQLLVHLEWWRAYYHFVRPHEALRVALVQSRERGGNRLAQRYRQQTPAMAAGRTHRRWTTHEVLSCPLPPTSA